MNASAQESLNTTGGEATGAGGTVSYSVGQVAYTTNEGSNGSVEQGVQHAYIISSAGIENPNTSLKVNLFPNPTVDGITLELEQLNTGDYYRLLDAQGQMVLTDQISALQTQIDTKDLGAATYYLELYNNLNQKQYQFKIIKN